jgi:hypothetical protein
MLEQPGRTLVSFWVTDFFAGEVTSVYSDPERSEQSLMPAFGIRGSRWGHGDTIDLRNKRRRSA